MSLHETMLQLSRELASTRTELVDVRGALKQERLLRRLELANFKTECAKRCSNNRAVGMLAGAISGVVTALGAFFSSKGG